MTWQAGRQLSGIEKDYTEISYKYNDSGIRTEKLANGIKTEYYIIGDTIAAEKRSDGIKIIYLTDESGVKIGFSLSGSSADGTYYYIFNAQGDVIGIYNSDGEKVVEYSYDSWGKLLSVTGSLADSIGDINPIRYRGYYYDAETGFYYLQSRYYDPEVGRWINIDGELSNIGGNIIGYNLFVYCFNNPVNMNDPSGNWPKWLSGVLNIVGGALQVAAGAVLGATVGWTGFGAIAAGFLVINGSATVTQGFGQIVNHVTNTPIMREDNIVRTGIKEIGRTIYGDTGAKIAGGAYDIAVIATNLYAGKIGLQQAGKIPIKVNINNVVNNPLDEFVTIGPADGIIQQYYRTIPQIGYGKIYATQLGNGLYQIANGHHRVAALRSLGYETIKIFLTK